MFKRYSVFSLYLFFGLTVALSAFALSIGGIYGEDAIFFFVTFVLLPVLAPWVAFGTVRFIFTGRGLLEFPS